MADDYDGDVGGDKSFVSPIDQKAPAPKLF